MIKNILIGTTVFSLLTSSAFALDLIHKDKINSLKSDIKNNKVVQETNDSSPDLTGSWVCKFDMPDADSVIHKDQPYRVFTIEKYDLGSEVLYTINDDDYLLNKLNTETTSFLGSNDATAELLNVSNDGKTLNLFANTTTSMNNGDRNFTIYKNSFELLGDNKLKYTYNSFFVKDLPVSNDEHTYTSVTICDKQ